MHADATDGPATDWAQIVALYDLLEAQAPSPVVQVNRAVALAMRDGPETGLAALETIDAEALRAYHLLPAAQAELLRRLGRRTEAASAYRAAIGLVANERERAYLRRKLRAVTSMPCRRLPPSSRSRSRWA